MNLLLLLGSLVFCCFRCVHSQEVTLYDEEEYRGQSVKVQIGSCRNVMDLDFNDKTTSVKTSKCVRIWQHSNCGGRSVDIQPPGNPNLGADARFNNELTSVSECTRFGGVSDDVDITVDTSEATDMKEYGEKAKLLMRRWFPFMQNLMTSPSYRPVTKINMKFPKVDRGIFASGNYIEVPAQYLRNNPNDWGVFIHEMTHVIHQARCPGWVVEGMAEWTRRWFYEPKSTKKPPKGSKMDNDYLGDWLLAYLNSVVGRPIIYDLNKACQEGSWYDGLVKDLTGKNEKEWWDIMINDDSFPFKRA